MRNVFLGLALLILATSTKAQEQEETSDFSIESKPIKHTTACINHAIKNKRVEKEGENIRFICDRDIARNFFNFLSNKTTKLKRFHQGTYQYRYFIDDGTEESDYCLQKIEDADGYAVSGVFLCVISLPMGSFINE